MLTNCPENFPSVVIHGDRFAAIADAEINFNADGTQIHRNVESIGRGAKIVFVKTDFIGEVFKQLHSMEDPAPFVLITHNSDIAITRELYQSSPRCVIRWYALNVDHYAPNVLIPIPSGMERPGGGGYSANYQNVVDAWNDDWMGRPCWVLGNWNINNNVAERTPARVLFDNRSKWQWVDYGIGHLNFLQRCVGARFVMSPPGNGIDCHRTWEALYCGAIPIVKLSQHTEAFTDLPILTVEDWSILSDALLDIVYDGFQKTPWKMEMAFFPYWEGRILKDAELIP